MSPFQFPRSGTLVLTVLVISGCVEDTPTTSSEQPTRSISSILGTLPIPIDSVFEDEPMMAVARELPTTFGGFWYNEQKQIVVGLTNSHDLEAAERLIRPWLGANEPTEFIAEAVDYTFLELAAYRTLLRRRVFRIPGVVALGVNEADNRVKVALAERASEGMVRDLLEQLDIPSEMVMFTSMPYPTEAVLELTDAHPDGKIQGGWQIERTGYGTCTLGFSALDPSDGYSPVFVTNTHCTESIAAFDGGSMWQPAYLGSSIGEEILDPTPHTCGYPGFEDDCRHADAALFSADVDIQLGTIVRTTTSSGCDQCSAGIVVDTANPSIAITGRLDNVFENETLQKVGRTTGWTYGAVEDTCDDVEMNDLVRQCSDRVDFSAGPGDSGSPVFDLKLNGTAEIRGILFGEIGFPYNDAWISDLNQIEKDLGYLWIWEPTISATIGGPDLVPPSAVCEWDGTYQGRPPFTFEWRRDGLLVSTGFSYSTTDTGTTGFQLSFEVTDALSNTDTDYLWVDIDSGDPGFMCTS